MCLLINKLIKCAKYGFFNKKFYRIRKVSKNRQKKFLINDSRKKFRFFQINKQKSFTFNKKLSYIIKFSNFGKK